VPLFTAVSSWRESYLPFFAGFLALLAVVFFDGFFAAMVYLLSQVKEPPRV
jgi:hypothetical protein